MYACWASACQGADSEEPNRPPGPLYGLPKTQQPAGSASSNKTGQEAAPATPEGRHEGGHHEQPPTPRRATAVTTSGDLCRALANTTPAHRPLPGQGARRRRTWKANGEAGPVTARDVDERVHRDIDELAQPPPEQLRVDAHVAESNQHGEPGPDRGAELEAARRPGQPARGTTASSHRRASEDPENTWMLRPPPPPNRRPEPATAPRAHEQRDAGPGCRAWRVRRGAERPMPATSQQPARELPSTTRRAPPPPTAPGQTTCEWPLARVR